MAYDIVDVLEALGAKGCDPTKSGDGWKAKCPTHDDRNPSLSVWEVDERGNKLVRVKCHSNKNCTYQGVLQAIGIGNNYKPTVNTPKTATTKQSWNVCDVDGKLIAVHFRIDSSNGKKSYPWELPDGTKGLGGIKTSDLPLYGTERLTTLSDGDTVYITEGEKACDALLNSGYNAVGSITGGANPIACDNSLRPLIRFRCVVWADNDDVGRDHMNRIAARLMQLGCKDILQVNWQNAEYKDDAFDAVYKGCVDELTNTLVPWLATESDLSDILDRVKAFIRRFVILNDDQLVVLSAYVAHTYTYRACIYTPYIHIYSPTTECGKSSLIRALMSLVCQPAKTDSITKSALIRRVDRIGPTLLIDEFDATVKGSKEVGEAIRGILNSGFHLAGVYTMSDSIGNSWEDKDYTTFCPKVLSGISQIWETVQNRSIPIRMIRATPAEVDALTKFDERDHINDADSIQEDLNEWGTFYTAVLYDSRPQLPKGLGSRAQDICEPLVAIGDLAGGEWSTRIRDSVVALCNQESVSIQNRGVQLLMDCYNISKTHSEDKIKTQDLIDQLGLIEESGWGDYNRGKSISSSQLARLLREFQIFPKQYRFSDGSNVRGYGFFDFTDTWSRYCPAIPQNTVTGVTDDEFAPTVEPSTVADVTGVTSVTGYGERGEYLT